MVVFINIYDKNFTVNLQPNVRSAVGL